MYLELSFSHSASLSDINFPYADNESYSYKREERRQIKGLIHQEIEHRCQAAGCTYKLGDWVGGEFTQIYRVQVYVFLPNYAEGQKASDWLRWLPNLDALDPIPYYASEVKSARLVENAPENGLVKNIS